MIEKEKFTEALDYMIQSPFIQKMLGSTSNDEDKLAREINQSTYRLVDIKNDLKKSHDIFVAVGQDNPKEFSEIAAKHILDSYLTPMSEKCESAKKAYEVVPKVDEEYIAKLSREEAEIKEKTAKAALQLKANAEEEKIRVQKAMKSAQDKALKQQNDYFREQTENIKAQAKAVAEQARHAEQMAKYMEQNAKEAEDIRRRMDDEGFGRNRRI